MTKILLAMVLVLTATCVSAQTQDVTKEISFDDCQVTVRIKFKDGAGGCLRNYAEFMNIESIKYNWMNKGFNLAVTSNPELCPAWVGLSWGNNRKFLSNCQEGLDKRIGKTVSNCNCKSIESIAQDLTKVEFDAFAKSYDNRRTIGWKPSDLANKTVVAEGAPQQAFSDSQQQSQDKKNEDRRQKEALARAEDDRRQKEALAKAEDDRRQKEALAKVEDDRRQKEALARADNERRAQVAESTSRSNRKALVIGNDSYQTVSKLVNARADARAMGEVLNNLGYSVSSHFDLTEKNLKKALRVFMKSVSGGDEVMFFFAGHGVQIAGANYLLPTDVSPDDAETVKDEGLLLQRVLDELTNAKVKLSIAIIDACRDNPFKTASRALSGRGLAPTDTASGQMVVFSAGAGQQALDKVGPNDKSPNSLFTRTLLKHMQQKDIPIDRVMRQVRGEVVATAKTIGHEQVPALYDQVIGEFYFSR